MEDIPEEVRKSLTFHTVSTLDEVFAIALEPEGEMALPTKPKLVEETEEDAEIHATV